MKIGINASFARKSDSGMGQVTINFCKKLVELSEQKSSTPAKAPMEEQVPNEFVLYLEEDLGFDLPSNFEKKIFLPPYKRDDLVRKIWWEKFLLPKQAKKDNCDVFLSLYQSTTIFEKIKHAMFVHDTVPEIFPQYLSNLRKRIYYRLVKKAAQKADRVLTISEFSKKDITEHYQIPKEKISTIHIDCDPIFKEDYTYEHTYERRYEGMYEIKEKYKMPKGDYIFYVGGFDVRKNVDSLIEAFGILHQKNKNIPNLIIAGKFNPHLVPLTTNLPQKIKEVEKKYNIPEGKIKNIGFVLQTDLPVLYKKAKLFCYPTLHEGFGLPVLEAMNIGCPIVTSNNSSIPEVTGENGALLIENPKDPKQIATAMQKILSGDEPRNNLIANGKKEAQKFSWGKTVNKTLGIIKTLQ